MSENRSDIGATNLRRTAWFIVITSAIILGIYGCDRYVNHQRQKKQDAIPEHIRNSPPEN